MEISTKKYYLNDIPSHKIKQKCIIEVFNGDCFQATEKYVDSVIHNFANNTRPGGPTSQFNESGFLIWQKSSSKTQEDQIIRKYQQNIKLYPHMYPICDDSKINGEALLYSKCGILKPVITIASPINPNFENKKIIGKKQSDRGTFYPRRKPEDNEIDLQSRFIEKINHLRACENTHPAFFYYKDMKYNIMIEPELKPKFPSDLKITFYDST